MSIGRRGRSNGDVLTLKLAKIRTGSTKVNGRLRGQTSSFALVAESIFETRYQVGTVQREKDERSIVDNVS